MEIVIDKWEDLSTVKRFEAVHFALTEIENLLAGMGGKFLDDDITRWYVSKGFVCFNLNLELQWTALLEYYEKSSGQGEGNHG